MSRMLASLRLLLISALPLPLLGDLSHASGDLYVTSDSSDVVRRYAGGSGAYLSTLLSSGAATGELGIHFGASNNRVLVGHFNGGVEEYNAVTGAYIKTYNPGGGTQWAGVYGPNGNVLIGDWNTDDVREYDATSGTLIGILTTIPDPADMLIGPNGNLYICSFSVGAVKEVNATFGTFVSSWRQPNGSQTNDIAFNANGEILVTTMQTNLVCRYNSLHVLQGTFTGAGWQRPHGIRISPWSGNVLVVDGVTGQVHEFHPTTYVELNSAFLTPFPGGKIVDLDFFQATCSTKPGQCCAGRPDFDAAAYAGFGSLVSVGTASPQAVGSAVVAVFNLGDPNAGPFNTSYPTTIYSDPSWSQTNLGSVFGVALDPAGNIYVSSTTCYSSDVVGSGTSGSIYKIDTNTSAVTVFATIPDSGRALGNLCYDCEFDQFFATSMEDGKIYRIDSAGAIQSTFDFGAPDNPLNLFPPLGDRVWAVQKHGSRVYFSVWWEDAGNQSATQANEIWSVALDALGEFTGAAVLEFTMPGHGGIYSNPVSDMRFTPTGSLLLAERGMSNETNPTPHQARLLEIECQGGAWGLSSNVFNVGAVGTQDNCAGGVDIDSRPCGRVFVTGDALQLGPQTIYGTQGLPVNGGSVTNSILVDYNGDLSIQDKTFIGDVAVPCLPGSACLPILIYCEPSWGITTACPCSNPPASVFRGCDNSSGTGGASLTATGSPTLVPDTLVFTTADEKPTATTVLLQGTTSIPAGVVFGQGVRCIGGVLKRLYVKSAVGGSITAPSGADPTVSARSAALGDPISAGQHRYYQAYYRDPIVLGGCPSAATFNITNAGDVTWL